MKFLPDNPRFSEKDIELAKALGMKKGGKFGLKRGENYLITLVMEKLL